MKAYTHTKLLHECSQQHHSQYPQRENSLTVINCWVNKMWYIHTMEYYSVTKRNETLDTCYNMDEPRKIMVLQSQRPYIIWYHFYEISRISKSIETESRLVKEEHTGVTVKGCRIFFLEWWKYSKMNCGEGCAAPNILSHWTRILNGWTGWYVNYINKAV